MGVCTGKFKEVADWFSSRSFIFFEHDVFDMIFMNLKWFHAYVNEYTIKQILMEFLLDIKAETLNKES